MNTTSPAPEHATAFAEQKARLPIVTLLLLAVIGFVLITMETLPAGLLPVIADGLNTSEVSVGLLVSAYALGTVIVTIPAISLTRSLRRKPLLLAAIAGLITANTLTAISNDLVLALSSRFIAGAFSGIIWGMLAAYGLKISAQNRAGVALAIVSAGAPVGFALGTPLGSWLGTALDWRWAFIALSLLALIASVALALVAPDAAGQDSQSGRERIPVVRVFRLPGVAITLAVIFAWMLASNTVYTYLTPYLRTSDGSLHVDMQLFIFGVSSVAGIALVGALLDRHPRLLLHGSLVVFTAAAVTLLVGHASTPAIIIATVLWGVTFGGAPAQLQAALTTSGGRDSDVANSFLPVAFNVAIFVAGILGAALLAGLDGLALPVVMIVFGLIAFALTIVGRRTAFSAPPGQLGPNTHESPSRHGSSRRGLPRRRARRVRE